MADKYGTHPETPQTILIGKNVERVDSIDKVLGKPPIVLPATTIINAIDHAIGVRITEIPATPDRILSSYRKRN